MLTWMLETSIHKFLWLGRQRGHGVDFSVAWTMVLCASHCHFRIADRTEVDVTSTNRQRSACLVVAPCNPLFPLPKSPHPSGALKNSLSFHFANGPRKRRSIYYFSHGVKGESVLLKFFLTPGGMFPPATKPDIHFEMINPGRTRPFSVCMNSQRYVLSVSQVQEIYGLKFLASTSTSVPDGLGQPAETSLCILRGELQNSQKQDICNRKTWVRITEHLFFQEPVSPITPPVLSAWTFGFELRRRLLSLKHLG
jgi:hypothetical protein